MSGIKAESLAKPSQIPFRNPEDVSPEEIQYYRLRHPDVCYDSQTGMPILNDWLIACDIVDNEAQLTKANPDILDLELSKSYRQN